MPREVDVTRPSVARMYDYYLGGKDNYAADREAARLVLGAAPDVPLAALENREFLKRAIRYLAAEHGISQFVDIGPGLPTQGNVHQLTRQHNPGAKVAYADNDPGVLTHARELLGGVPDVTIIPGDLREPDRILADPTLATLIDFSHPVALFMTLVLHFVPPTMIPTASWPGSGTRCAPAASWSCPMSRATTASPPCSLESVPTRTPTPR